MAALAASGLLGTLEWNEAGVLVGANQAFLTISGRTLSALQTGALRVDQLFRAPPQVPSAASTSGPLLVEQELFLENGEHLPVLLGDAPLPGTLPRWAGFVLDHSEQRKRTELEDLLLAIVSHDLRNPLAAIAMGASLLLGQSLTEVQHRVVARLDSAARRSVRLVSDLLDFTAARGTGIELVHAARDLHAITEQAIDDMRASWSERAIEHRRIGDGSVFVDGDRVGQVVANLVGNALQHSPAATAVVVETRGEPGGVVLVVHNYGRAIPDSLLPELFKPLQRGIKPGYRRGSLGLGLFIVQHLVVAHGGSVEVASSEADGTRFTVRLPRESRPLRVPAEPPDDGLDESELDSMA